MIARGVMGRGEMVLKASKEKLSGKISITRSLSLSKAFGATPEVISKDDVLAVNLSFVANDGGGACKHTVALDARSLRNLIAALANPKDQSAADAISKVLSGSARDLTRLTAMAAGTMPKI